MLKQMKKNQKDVRHVRSQLGGLGGVEDIEILQLIQREGGAPQLIQRAQKIQCVPELRVKLFRKQFGIQKDKKSTIL